ncbi:RICIN domain-containing protein [Microbacterium testaceum]|uniref:RICIN domain-containing protein n=1 Tax=Microbacterium testaceum TaxID=2033 RepID=UPI00380138F0
MHQLVARPRKGRLIAAAAIAITAGLFAATVSPTTAKADDQSVGVNFAVSGGAPQYLASGTIYGMTENGQLPQDHFFTDIKWNYMRAGGAQLDNPGGWVGGTYPRRWAATEAQAKRTAQLGGKFVILVHDLWGADAETNANVFPGDNGDWTNYDKFMNQLISDVQTSGVNVQWDIWNEPDIATFWQRSQDQYLAMWQRGYNRIRQTFPNAVIVGPSTSSVPGESWWDSYLNYVKANNVLPDIYSWHTLPADPVATTNTADSVLTAKGITRTNRYQINEYASAAQQDPANGSWYITRLERANAYGLRANWATGQGLNDNMAKLLVKSNGQYLPTGEWWMYRFYGSQVGSVVQTTPSASYDAFATKTNGSAKILLGGGGTTGNMSINLSGLNATSGIVSNNQVRVVVQTVPYNGGGAVSGPQTVSSNVVSLANNATTVNIPRTNGVDGFTITLLPPTAATPISTVAVSPASGQCLDDTNLSTSAGTQQQQFFCEGGYQQTWDFTPVSGTTNTYTVKNELSGQCLDVGSSTSDGSAVVQNPCSTTATSQRFTLNKVTALGSGPRDYQLAAVSSGKCVDVNGASTNPRTPIIQWGCKPLDQLRPGNQTWSLPGFQPGIIDDTATGAAATWTYNGTWGTATGVGDLFLGTAHWTNTSGASTSIAFTGTGLAVYGVKDVDQGIVQVSVDGAAPVTVDNYNATRLGGALLFSSGTLTKAAHTVVITSTGTKNTSSSNTIVALDSVIVTP